MVCLWPCSGEEAVPASITTVYEWTPGDVCSFWDFPQTRHMTHCFGSASEPYDDAGLLLHHSRELVVPGIEPAPASTPHFLCYWPITCRSGWPFPQTSRVKQCATLPQESSPRQSVKLSFASRWTQDRD